MKKISLTNGKVALVDDCDYEYLMQWRWQANGDKYARRIVWHQRYGEPIWMHRVIAERMGLDIVGKKIDHFDGNKLNDRRDNLRIATNQQNGSNRGRNRNNTSGYKGVCWHCRRGKWQAMIRVDGRLISLGYSPDKIEAAKRYNEAAIEYFGEFARLNPVK